MTVDEIKALVMRFVEEPWTRGNVDVLDELCDPAYTLRHEPENMIASLEDQKRNAREARMSSPDLVAEVQEIIVEGDRVAYEFTFSWTEDGKPFKAYGITILHLKNGKVIEDRFVMEMEKIGETA